MIKSVLSFILLANPNLSEQQLQAEGNAALRAREYERAATTWERLARRDPLKLNRAGVIYAAVTAWQYDYEANRHGRSVCAALGLLQWYFTRSGTHEPELVELYRQRTAIKRRDGITCKLRPSAGQKTQDKPRVAEAKLDQPDAKPVISPRPHQRLTIAGALLTSVGVGGLAGMTVALVGHAKHKQRLLDIGVHGPQADSVYQQGRMLERWAIASGVTGGISLVTGVALLAVARRQRLVVTPQLGGLTIHGRF